MVGGVNDAPALARADVRVAIGAGTDVAIESVGVVLAGDDARAVLSIVELSRASYRKMWQNLIWATGYNLVAVPIAAGVLAFAGVVLPPAAGRRADVGVHRRRGGQRAAAAPPWPRPGPTRGLMSSSGPGRPSYPCTRYRSYASCSEARRANAELSPSGEHDGAA